MGEGSAGGPGATACSCDALCLRSCEPVRAVRVAWDTGGAAAASSRGATRAAGRRPAAAWPLATGLPLLPERLCVPLEPAHASACPCPLRLRRRALCASSAARHVRLPPSKRSSD